MARLIKEMASAWTHTKSCVGGAIPTIMVFII